MAEKNSLAAWLQPPASGLPAGRGLRRLASERAAAVGVRRQRGAHSILSVVPSPRRR
jgi:hypothetical protein